jgi:hypothetical protein
LAQDGGNGADWSYFSPCKFLLDDGSLLFVHESQITPEIESLMASLGSPTEGYSAAAQKVLDVKPRSDC